MNGEPHEDSGRAGLRFVDAVRHSFAFLEVRGFAEIEALPTLVRFGRGELEVILYHGRRSYELHLDVKYGRRSYPLSMLIRAADSVAADAFRYPAATTVERVNAGVERLAEFFRRYGGRALDEDGSYFGELDQLQKALAAKLALDVRESQVRPKAELAFREGRYREAALLYASIAERLSPAEKAKLEAARKRS